VLSDCGIEEVMLKLYGEHGERVLMTLVSNNKKNERMSENVEDATKIVMALCKFANAQLLIFEDSNCKESSYKITSVYLSG
jgi:hypothetical protein